MKDSKNKDLPSNEIITGNLNEKKPKKDSNERKPFTKWIIISTFSFLLIGLIILIILLITKKPGINEISQISESPPPNSSLIRPQCDSNECFLSYEEAIKCLEPTFKIASKPYILNHILMKSSFKHNSISFDNVTTLSVFTKAKFDIYTLNESLAEKEDKDFYSKKYFTVVTINSFCMEFSGNKTDCKLKKYLDLNLKVNNNLRGDDNLSPKAIENAILPICIFEHTDSNIILSITCPNTLSTNIKNNIINAFRNIKHDSIKGINEKNKENINITTKNNNTYIDSFSTICDDYDDTSIKGRTCNITKNIVTDLNGNLIFMKKNSTSITIKDKNNQNNKIKLYYYEDISDKNSQNFDSDNYKKNLNIVFDLVKLYMEKDDLISQTSFNGLIKDLMNGDLGNLNTSKTIRRLEEEENKGVWNEPIFSKEIYDIKVSLDKLIDLGLEFGANSRAQSSLQNGNNTHILSLNEENLKLFEIMNKFIEISKSSKFLTSGLQKQLNQPLLDIRDYIDSNIKDLNNLLVFNDLSSVFDSTLSISKLSKIPYSIVSSVENLYFNLNEINKDVNYLIDDNYNNLKQTISSFLADSHNLIFNIFFKFK